MAGGTVPKPGEATLSDLLAHPGMRKTMALWGPIVLVLAIGAALTVDAAWQIPAGLLYGALAYSLMEYLTHRFLYHWEPRQRLWRRINAKLGPPHLGHHEKPTEYKGAIMLHQMPMVIVMLVCLGLLFLLPLPPAFVFATVAIGALGFALHEAVHFGCHQMPMRHPALAYLKRRHLFHHYRDENVNFGTTSPLWDIVLGTNYVPGKPSRARPYRHRVDGGGTADGPAE